MVRIVWSKTALLDLKEIKEFISQDSEKYAKIQIQILRHRTNILKKNPLAGKISVELNRKDIRELVEGNYRIIYRVVAKNSIRILLVNHGARKLKNRNI